MLGCSDDDAASTSSGSNYSFHELSDIESEGEHEVLLGRDIRVPAIASTVLPVAATLDDAQGRASSLEDAEFVVDDPYERAQSDIAFYADFKGMQSIMTSSVVDVRKQWQAQLLPADVNALRTLQREIFKTTAPSKRALLAAARARAGENAFFLDSTCAPVGAHNHNAPHKVVMAGTQPS